MSQIIVENKDWQLSRESDGKLRLAHTSADIDMILTKQQLLSLQAIIDGAVVHA
jgi:hypothetical protein